MRVIQFLKVMKVQVILVMQQFFSSSMCYTQACVDGKTQYFVFKGHNYTTKRGPYAVNSDR